VTNIRLGLGMLQSEPNRLIELVRLAESLGYDDLWYANERFFRDMYVGLTLCAVNTERMRLGTFVSDPYSLHPALTAVAIASVDEVSKGRAMVCLGAGGSGASPLGIPRVKPARAIGEAIQIIRGALSGERVTFEGEVFQFRGGKLNFQPRPDIPIYVASRGSFVLSTAGALADGVMIATFATPAGLRHGLSRVARGAERAGRKLEEIELVSRVDAAVADDPREAKEAVRPMVARMLTSSYPDRSFVQAIGLELPPAFEEIAAQRNRQLSTEMAHLVPDEVVDAFTWSGTAEQVAQQVAAVVDAGFKNVTFLPHGPDEEAVEPTIRAFAEQVRPRVEALLRG
jgi:5,10-methylenetetrahydromethanopterin reductase